MRNEILPLLAIASIAILSSCTLGLAKEPFENEQAVISRTTSALLEIDFSDLVSDCEYVTFLDLNSTQNNRERLVLGNQQIKTLVGDIEELTEGELIRLGVWVIPDGKRLMLIDLHKRLARHYMHYGELPGTAIGLFPELSKLTEEEVAALDRNELFQKYAIAINPITGKFYDSFSTNAWTPGGYYVEVVDDPVEIAERWPHHKMRSRSEDPSSELVPPDSVWQIRLFGESSNSVIFEMLSCSQ